MENSANGHNTLGAMLCRRSVQRTALPVEVELWKGNLIVVAIIRDVSISNDEDSPFIGIGLFHNDALPLDETINCRTVLPSEFLPVESTISLMWTRHFGSDGFLSGGRMAMNHAAGYRDGEYSVAAGQSANRPLGARGDS
jgi:hypothetical protein